MQVVDRKTKNEYTYEPSKFVKYMYEKKSGRFFLKLLNNRVMANISRIFMNTFLSIPYKNKIIKKNHVDMSLYEDKKYLSYNSYFTRRLKKIDFVKDNKVFIAPCESKLLVLKIDNNTSFDIKGSKYTLSEILKDDIYKEYNGGYAMIFRLEATNYHRYIFLDSGTRDEYKFIKGKLNTVQPIAYKHFKVFHENCREWTVLHTDNFDDVIHMEIGAMMIGKINNNDKTSFKRGDEKGFFSFGGSTILLLVKKNIIKINDDIMNNSQEFKETTVNIGEEVAKKIK
jgi:phosphatidylserine decarboxylase